jgi:hypothetical protein
MTSLLRRIRAIIRHLLGRATLEREMHAEFTSHIQLRADDLERRGLARDAAERAARIEFGGVEAQKDAARDARGLRWWQELQSNVVFAVRGLGHHPIQSLIVVATLTLGIGICAVVFSVMSALAFRARVDRDAATFTRILVSYRTDTTGPSFPGAAPVRDYLAYARAARSLSSIAGWQPVRLSLSDGAPPTPGSLVTCSFFDVYGPVRPIAGRMLQRDDCDSNTPVAVIGNELWHTTFGADTARSAACCASTGKRFASSASRRRSPVRRPTTNSGCRTRCANRFTSGRTIPNHRTRCGSTSTDGWRAE